MVELNIKNLLKKKNHSKYWFCQNMGGNYQFLSRLMNNETTSISFDTIDKLCDVLDCEISELIIRKGDQKKNE